MVMFEVVKVIRLTVGAVVVRQSRMKLSWSCGRD